MAKAKKEKKVEGKVEINEAENYEALSPAFAALIEKNLKPNKVLKYGEGDTELLIEVSHTIPVGIKAEAVRAAADLLFVGDGADINSYAPAFTDFAIRYGILIGYTNLNIPKNLHNAWAVILYTPIFDDTAEILGLDIIDDFKSDFFELVEARKQEIINSTNWLKIVNKIGEYASGVKDSLKDIDLSKFADELKSIKGIEGLDLSELFQPFTNKN